MKVENASEVIAPSAVTLSLAQSPGSAGYDADDDTSVLQNESDHPGELITSPKTADNASESKSKDVDPKCPLDEPSSDTSLQKDVEMISEKSEAKHSASSLSTSDWVCRECPDAVFKTALDLQYHLL